MRDHLATLLDDFRRYDREIAVVRYQGNRRHVTRYGELAQMAVRFAKFLEIGGIGPGNRVLIWGENSAEWIATFFGCMMRGVLAVPLDATGSPDFAARVARETEPKLVVADALLLDKLTGDWPHLAFEDWHSGLPAEEATPTAGLSHETPLQILFTSGTTGDPKGIVITHGNVLASVGPIEDASQRYLRYAKIVHPLRILHTLPLSHVFGQTMGLWIPQIYRAELHFESRLAAPRLIELIHRERISVVAAVPRVLALLKSHLELEHPGLTDQIAAAQKLKAWQRWWHFRKIHREFGLKFWAFVCGGGALPAPLEQFWNALGFVLVQGYGMTETTALITLNHPFRVARGTIGKPLAGREVKLGPDGEVLVRGPMISGATWSGGQMRPRNNEWLATGDLAEREPSGELKFVGRKSEVIVTAAGLNLHPEDMEAVIEEQPGIAACAVVAIETAAGPEPCAVLAMRGTGDHAAEAIDRANTRLADFQRIRRWVLYPEPDLPRTSTGKVKRKEVAAWFNRLQAASAGNGAGGAAPAAFSAQSDWLLTLISQISGETPHNVGDELRLDEDLHLDSLGRVQLSAAIEERLGVVSGSGLLEGVQTLGDLRKLIAGEANEAAAGPAPERTEETFRPATVEAEIEPVPPSAAPQPTATPRRTAAQPGAAPRTKFLYPTWPWWRPMQWIRAAFLEVIARPLTEFLAAPRVIYSSRGAMNKLDISEPMLIVGNHVTAYDGPLIQYALPGRLRRHIAVAMLGELLEDFRHARNPDQPPGHQSFYPLGPPAYWLVTALYNVFPLPRHRDFQSSFAHTGRALDRGYSVMIFPEGTRSAEGKLVPFRPGIGILVKQSHTAVLPIGLRGIGDLKVSRRWFRSGKLEVRVGEPIIFPPQATEAEITERLHAEVAKLMNAE
jgi:long-chain acyl-CoA synthetase